MKSKRLPSRKKAQLEFERLEAELKLKAEQSRTLKGWLSNRWGQFETWVHSWFPGLKTKIITGLGAIGASAAVLQQFITGLPVTKFITAESISIISAVMFALAFWFKGMGERVESKLDNE